MAAIYNYSEDYHYRSPYPGIYHKTSFNFMNLVGNDDVPPIFKANLRSVLENIESINSYYMLESINVTLLRDNDTLIGELIFSKRDTPIYYQDHQNPTITPSVMKDLCRDLDKVNIGVIHYLTTSLHSITGDMKAPEVFTITIKSQIQG